MAKVLPFQVFAPTGDVAPIPVVLDFPHSGRFYPDDFEVAVTPDELSEFEDGQLDLIFEGAAQLGAHSLVAGVARSYVDCNQPPCRIDPAMFALPRSVDFAGIAADLSYGLFPKNLLNGKNIYLRKMSLSEAQSRMQSVYFPYRSALERLVSDLSQRFSVVGHLSCRSMTGTKAADVCFSNGCCDSAGKEFIAGLCEVARHFGLSVGQVHESPIGSIVRDTGDPMLGVHSVEVYLHQRVYCFGGAYASSVDLSDCRRFADGLVRAATQFAQSCQRKEAAF
jgi:N-formylglutamate deformylase